MDEFTPLINEIIEKRIEYSEELAKELAAKYRALDAEDLKRVTNDNLIKKLDNDELIKNFWKQNNLLEKEHKAQKISDSAMQLGMIFNGGAPWANEDALDMKVFQAENPDHHSIKSKRHGFHVIATPDAIVLPNSQYNPKDMKAATDSMLLMSDTKGWKDINISGGNEAFKRSCVASYVELHKAGKITTPLKAPRSLKKLMSPEQLQYVEKLESNRKLAAAKDKQLNKQLEKAFKQVGCQTPADKKAMKALLRSDSDKVNLIKLADKYGGKIDWMSRQGGSLNRLTVAAALDDMRALGENADVPRISEIEDACVPTSDKPDITTALAGSMDINPNPTPEQEAKRRELNAAVAKVAMAKPFNASLKEVAKLQAFVTTDENIETLKALAESPNATLLGIQKAMEDQKLLDNFTPPENNTGALNDGQGDGSSEELDMPAETLGEPALDGELNTDDTPPLPAELNFSDEIEEFDPTLDDFEPEVDEIDHEAMEAAEFDDFDPTAEDFDPVSTELDEAPDFVDSVEDNKAQTNDLDRDEVVTDDDIDLSFLDDVDDVTESGVSRAELPTNISSEPPEQKEKTLEELLAEGKSSIKNEESFVNDNLQSAVNAAEVKANQQNHHKIERKAENKNSLK
ncbi:hypothetical protein ACPV5R_18665 [Vibrio astriarenae]